MVILTGPKTDSWLLFLSITLLNIDGFQKLFHWSA